MLAAVAVLTLLCLGNVLLTFGVIRRLNEHTAILDDLAGEPPAVLRPAGEVVGDFAATARDGTPVTPDLLGPPTFVAFLTPGCGPCQQRLPDIVTRARRAPAGRTLAVVVTPSFEGDAAAQALADQLGGVATLVVESPRGPLSTAFGVTGFPAFALVVEGRIEASGVDPASIPRLVAA